MPPGVARIGLGLTAACAIGLAGLPAALGQNATDRRPRVAGPADAALRTEPTTDMEVTVVLQDGGRLEGTLVSINPERLTLRMGAALRDIDRSTVRGMEYEIVLVMRDGQRLVGTLLEQGRDWFTVRIAGVQARVPVDTVERVELQMPLRRKYEQMRSLIDDGDVERLLLVAEWLRSVGMYDEALEEIEHVLEVDPFNDKGRQLRELVSRQIELRDRQRRRAEERSSEPERPDPRPDQQRDRSEPDGDDEDAERSPPSREVPMGQRRDFPLLSESQVNLIKVYELDLRDPPRLLIDRETIDLLLERYAGSPLLPATRTERDRFYRRSPEEILDIIFQLQARDLYGRVRVLGQVESMKDFRDHVQTTWLLQNCSTSGCHGGENASGLTLYARRPGSEQSVYTNFLILDRYRTADGQALIDWQTPDRSLLMQMGMNRDNAFRPHPEVRGWRPVFRDSSDRRFRQAVSWIERMYRPRAEWPVDYDPPGEAARGDESPPEGEGR